MKQLTLSLFLTMLWSLTLPTISSAADDATIVLSEGGGFVHKDGESLYRSICAGCHMPDGQGAKGAGTYPALAGNPRLAAATYPVHTILQGRHGMPAFKGVLSDAQVAEVTNYVRSHFGNDWKDAVIAAQVRPLR